MKHLSHSHERQYEATKRENFNYLKRKKRNVNSLHFRQKIKNIRENTKQKSTEQQEEILEKTTPKSLKPYSSALVSAVINHNSFTRKHINNERAMRAYQGIDFLIKQGIPSHIAMGILANGIAESGLSTESKKEGLGIFQWIGIRAQRFRAMRSRLVGNNEFEKQLSFMLYELKTTESATANALRGARTPEAAARIFLVKFERPKINNFSERSAIATGLRKFANI